MDQPSGRKYGNRGRRLGIRLHELEEQLDSFNSSTRRAALEEIVKLVQSGQIDVPPTKAEVNIHYHSFYSFNANGWSPSRIVWEAKKYGLEVAGIVDFDVLDGMEEFLSAGEILDIKTVVGLETRVFIKELAEHVMSSPNEPGIAYFMASGCFKLPPTGSEAEQTLQLMAKMARLRNIAVMQRVNDYLNHVQLDYEADVIPLTPSGNATERHLLTAYDRKAREVFPNDEHLVRFWSDRLGLTADETESLISNTSKFHEVMRSKLMKLGGVGYVPPDSESFPSIEEAVAMIRGMEALPTIAWLDGTNSGEADIHAFLSLLESKGVVAINIIPDRNWNFKDPREKAVKVAKLTEAVEAARKFGFPILVGTEMNKAGLPFVDSFQAPELQPFLGDFISGARVIYGHTLLARYAGFGYWSEGAECEFGTNRKSKNRFFERAGTPSPNARLRQDLSTRAGQWTAKGLLL